jgi:sugar phosphate isomerase/epimerase
MRVQWYFESLHLHPSTEIEMKLGVMAALFAGRKLEDVAAYCAEIQLDAIELPVGAYPGKPFFDPAKVLASKKEQDRIKGILKDHDLALSGLAVHGNPVHPDKKHAANDHRDFVNAVKLAPLLGTDVVITFSGCRRIEDRQDAELGNVRVAAGLSRGA